MAFSKFTKKIIYIASITSAVVTIGGAIGWVYNEYQDHKRTEEKQLNERIIKLIKENEDVFIEKIDSLNHRLKNIEGDDMFAVGFRANENGKLYYRDMSGKSHEVYYDQQYDVYYIIEDNKYIYLNFYEFL